MSSWRGWNWDDGNFGGSGLEPHLAKNESALHFLMRHVMAKERLPVSIEEIVERPHVRLVERVEPTPIDEIQEADPELVADALASFASTQIWGERCR